jgi:hypothetical protein
MKHIILAAVLSMAHVAMAGTPGFAITNGSAPGLYNILYQSNAAHRVNILIRDSNGRAVVEKTYRSTLGFKQPVNLSALRGGKYTVTLTDGENEYSGVIDHAREPSPSVFHVARLREGNNKFIVSVVVPHASRLSFTIYDQHNNVLHYMRSEIQDEYATIVKLPNGNGPFVFEVSDSDGTRQQVVR